MKLFKKKKKSNVRRSTRSQNRMHERLELDFGVTVEDIPPFGNHWDPPTLQTEVQAPVESKRSA